MNEIVKQESAQMSTSEMLMRAAQAPDVDAAKIRELWEIKREMDAAEARTAFYRAMKACQDEIRPIVKTSQNAQTGSKYAKLEAIDRLIRPIYQKHGFALMWNSPVFEATNQNKVNVGCKVIHTAGHAEPFTLPGPLDIAGLKGNQNKTEMHALGSSLSYLKRYLKCFIFDITLTDEVDDATGAVERVTDEQLAVIEKFIDECKMTELEALLDLHESLVDDGEVQL